MVSDTELMRRLLYGIRRQFQDGPARSARAKATIQRVRPWERGRIGKVEERISRETMFACKLEFTTGELVRLVYCSPGQMALAVTPCSASSSATVLVKPARPRWSFGSRTTCESCVSRRAPVACQGSQK